MQPLPPPRALNVDPLSLLLGFSEPSKNMAPTLPKTLQKGGNFALM